MKVVAYAIGAVVCALCAYQLGEYGAFLGYPGGLLIGRAYREFMERLER